MYIIFENCEMIRIVSKDSESILCIKWILIKHVV